MKAIRDDSDGVRRRLALRGAGAGAGIEELLALDERRRNALSEAEALKAARNRGSKEIGMLMGQKRLQEAEARKAEIRELGDRIGELDREAAAAESARDQVLLGLPNLPHDTVPTGASAEDNVVVRSWGRRPEFSFEPQSHQKICERLGLVDFARGAKLSGSGFLLYTGWGARLERALIQFLLDLHVRDHGYVEIAPPYVVRRACMEGVGQFPKFHSQAYGVLEGDDADKRGELYLVPTAEAPVANIHREEILRAEQLPLCYAAYSPCFRAEAGAAGVGTRGMIRVHQFDKVELIRIVEPDQGYQELEMLVGHAERVLQALGLHYRVVALCTGDLGFASAKTYDLEVWAPGQGSYLEVSSCSNCETFQARRMNLRFRNATGANVFPHILNGSGTALARLFVALLESCQAADGTIELPEPLRPYLGTLRLAP